MADSNADAKPRWAVRLWRTRDDWGPTWVARVVALVGLVSVLSAALPDIRARLHLLLELLPPFAPAAANAATFCVGVLLVAVARGLRRRKRRAWQLATVLAGSAVLLHIVKGLDVEEAALSAAVLALLLLTRGAFVGVPDPRSWRHTIAVFLVGLVGVVGAGMLLMVLNTDRMSGHPDGLALLSQVLHGLVGLPGPVRFTSADAAGDTAATLAVLGGTTLVLTILSLLRPARGPHPLTGVDERQLRDLLECQGGNDSLGYFALRRDKAVVFSGTGKAAIGYRVVSGVSLAGGDPIGDPEAWPGAVSAWLEEARRYAWAPAVLGASERGAELFHRHGLDALELGDEAVLDVDSFTLDGRAMRAVRQAVGRIRRAGVTCRIDRVDELTDGELTEARANSVRWRNSPTERGFSMALGRFGDRADGRCVVVRAYDCDGRQHGLLNFVPWGPDGLSLDLMRRDRHAENGLVEFMVTELVEAAPRLGVRRISLNFAVFRAAFERGERLGAGPALRIWRRVLLEASRFWQIESLYRANAKYRPVWEPRFLCFAEPRDLPRIGVAALHAEALVTRPRWLGGNGST